MVFKHGKGGCSMKIAVISDIHGNMDAFSQVLADLESIGPDQVFCLGDNIGYGPEPEAVVQALRKQDIPCVMGNHELALTERMEMDWFNPIARTSLQKTTRMLSDASIEYLRHLPLSRTWEDIRLVHGFPPASATTYLFQVGPNELKSTFAQMKERICFVGHTHELEIIGYDPATNKLNRCIPDQLTVLDSKRKYIINAGSVGQPRDGNNKAKYLIWEPDTETVQLRFVSYDIASAVNKIRAAGLPQIHADRLWG